MPTEQGRAEWVEVIRDLVSTGESNPGVLLTAFTSHFIETRSGQKNSFGGIYPWGISLVAEAIGRGEDDTAREVIAQTAHREGAARAMAGATPGTRKVPRAVASTGRVDELAISIVSVMAVWGLSCST